jgi:prepilin-type N-terminal cleavage/methylation domain-containing protein/prepilin-type processing-associated H-X9-DG protein
MLFRKQGFTLIELLVVIAIIAILAAILFPVFARAREKARQTTCTSNQRQIAASVQMYAQDHEETLPDTASVWSAIKVDPGVLVCPTLGKGTPNGYGYTALNANKAIGNFNDPTSEILTVDATLSAGNLFAKPGDIDYRHSNAFIVSYLDGHVAVQTITPTFGLALLGSKNSVGAITVTYNAATPTVPPVVTFPSGSLPKRNVGSNGYVLPRWKNITPPTNAGATPTKVFFAPFTDTYTTELFSDGNSWTGCNIIVNGTSATSNSGNYGAVASYTAGSTLTVPITVTDTELHTLTILGGARFGSTPKSRYTLQTDTGAAPGREASVSIDIPLDQAPNAMQFSFRFKCKLTFTNLATHSDTYTKAGVAGMFFD